MVQLRKGGNNFKSFGVKFFF